MSIKLDFLKETPSQTAGPYVHIGMTPNAFELNGVYPEDLGKTMILDGAKGERITITGRIVDGANSPVSDCVVEIWQADSAGLYNATAEHRAGADKNFTGWGRVPANEAGVFTFETIKPGAVPAPNGGFQAPHVALWIVARGINIGLHTRMYFSDEEAANLEDPILKRVRPTGRLNTLIGTRTGDTYQFDIYLQGENETVFFDI